LSDPKITGIRVMVLRDKDTPPWQLIRVDTDQGVWGLGEAYWGWGYRKVIEEEITPLLLGENPLDVDRLYTKVTMSLAGAHTLSGLVVSALSGVEIALWDLAGKITGLPVYRLLGGKFRDRVRMYRTTGGPNLIDLGACKELAAQIKSQGWTAIKTIDVESQWRYYDPEMREPGREPLSRRITMQDLRRTEKMMDNLRQAFGEDYEIAVHCHWSYELREAQRLVERIAPYNPLWLEDPLPAMFSPAWVRLTETSRVPICTGENLYTKHEYRPFIEQHGIDIVQIDIPKSGGLLETKRIADMADTHYLQVTAHNASSIVGYIASAHCACTVRAFNMMERAGGEWPWLEDLVYHDEPFFKDGHIRVPTGPGLGITLNPEVVKQHLAPGETYWGD
jgi:L-alanine-DL-glutamate epimerase-like enolase superfamily enzyme